MVLTSMSWLCTSSSANFFHYGKVPELFRNSSGTKTKKLKHCFFLERSRKRFSIWIQFFSFGSGTIPKYLRKNWKTVFSREIQEEILHMDSVFQFWFGNYSGIFAEKLKNCFSREIQEEILHMDSVFQFWFGNYFGIFAEKLKTWKTVFPKRSRKRFSIWIQFFSFSVLLHHMAGTTVKLFFESLFITCHLFCIYHLYMVLPQKKLPKSRVCVKHCKYHCFCTTHRFFWGATICIYIYLLTSTYKVSSI